MSRVIVFEVSEDAEGCYAASAVGESIYAEGETMRELRRNVCAAVHSQFCDSADPPKFVIMRIAGEQEQRITLPNRFFEPFGLHSVPEKELNAMRQGGSEIHSSELEQKYPKTKPCVCEGSNQSCRYCEGSGYVVDDKAIPHLRVANRKTWMPNSFAEPTTQERPLISKSREESPWSGLVGCLWWYLVVPMLIFLVLRLFK